MKQSSLIWDIFGLVKLQAGLEFTGSPRCVLTVRDFRRLWGCTACRGVRLERGHVRHQAIITLKDNQPQLTKSLPPAESIFYHKFNTHPFLLTCNKIVHVYQALWQKNVRLAQAGNNVTTNKVPVCYLLNHYTHESYAAIDIQFTYIKIIFFHNSVNTDKNFKVKVSNKLLNNLIKQFVRNWVFFMESWKYFLIWG